MRLRPSSNRPSSLEAYRRVLRFIHRRGGTEGTKLPPQNELTAQLKVCAATLDTAMKWLIEDGVLTRRQRVGTIVLRPYPENPRRFIWRAALVMPPITRSYFGAVVAHYLHKHINGLGISDRTYMLSPAAAPGNEVSRRSPADFTGLKEDIDDGFLDVVITSTRLVCNKVPVCGAACAATARFGTYIDVADFFRRAASALTKRRCRRLLCVLPDGLDEENQAHITSQLGQLRQHLLPDGVDLQSIWVSNSSGAQIWPERQFVKRLLNTDEATRPDALIVQDDVSAQVISMLLSRTPYHPLMSALTNRQIPLTFGLRCLPFSVDIEQIAARTSDLLIKKLLAPRSSNQTVGIMAEQLPETNPCPYEWQLAESATSLQ